MVDSGDQTWCKRLKLGQSCYRQHHPFLLLAYLSGLWGHHTDGPAAPTKAMLQTLQMLLDSSVHTHPGICDLEFPQDILGHVVFRHRVNDKILVACRALCWPVLVALLLWTKGPTPGLGRKE